MKVDGYLYHVLRAAEGQRAEAVESLRTADAPHAIALPMLLRVAPGFEAKRIPGLRVTSRLGDIVAAIGSEASLGALQVHHTSRGYGVLDVAELMAAFA